MASSQDFKSVQENIQGALVSATRLTNQIAAEDLSFQRTSNPIVADELDDTSARLLDLTSSLLKSATKNTNLSAPNLEDADDVDVHWSRIVDVVDTLLEKADTCLDEYTGAIMRKAAPVEQPANAAKNRYALEPAMRNANIIKPQNAFEIKPDNLDAHPWRPLLTEKPHAIVPLEKSLGTYHDENNTVQYDIPACLPSLLQPPPSAKAHSTNPKTALARHAKAADSTFRYKHPYETEILRLEYPEHVFQVKEPILYKPFETTTATYVDTFEGVLQMLEELKEAPEIAIDTEHHEKRTYSGLLSLMQISTREKDWIVDTLQPWRHKLQVLNEVFADPKILKVLHGAYMDIIWLQRDLGLYIVGLFDTKEAAEALNYPGKGLAFLLKKFVDFDADKKYQLADWRIRPLPDEMFYYARSDTHYLLYIYDMLRNEVLQQEPEDPEHPLMRHVLEKSKEVALRRHQKYIYDSQGGQGPFGWYQALTSKYSGRMSKEQFAVFRAIHQWRDEVARREDESPVFIMSQPTLFNIAQRMPPDAKALHSLLDSGSYIAKREVSDLYQRIAKAKIEGANGPSLAEVIRRNGSNNVYGTASIRSPFPQVKEQEKTSVETKDLVSRTSQLWGDVAMSTRWETQPKSTINKSLQFELPWAQHLLSAQIVDKSDAIAEDPVSAEQDAHQGSAAAAASVPEDKEFTLKSGRKRTASEAGSGSDSESASEDEADTTSKTGAPDSVAGVEEIHVPEMDHSEQEKKKTKKAEKKARKRQRKEERKEQKEVKKAEKRARAMASEGKEEEESSDDEPFDYSQAKSVLKAERATANGKGPQQKAKFNPYGAMPDGPKPARRMHGEKAGKSATFKK
ncbi:ribonuclease H-like domain-containing protein [Xylariomycetidae sp. FL0641]|nr:ribonuclease H-like domain-containing protein [Xylariomycetidae sp. FL0641]